MCCPRSQVSIYLVNCPLGLVSVSSPEPWGFLATPMSIVFLSCEDTNQTMRTDYAPELGSSWVKTIIHYPENLKGMYCAEERGHLCKPCRDQWTVPECWHTPEQSIKARCCLLFSKRQRGPSPCPPGVCFVLLAFLWG